MADRRLFAKTVIDSDAFLDMPLSTQALYFHLGMRADDEGFVNNPKKVTRMVNASEDDLKVLITKKFIIPFESGVVVIKHWHINNSIRADRRKETVYKKEKEMLVLKENGAYSLCQPTDNQLTTNCQPNDRISQSNLSQDNISQDNINQSICDRLTDDQWDKIDATYDDIVGLIDLIDERLKLSTSKINNPYAYIIKVARDEGWPTK